MAETAIDGGRLIDGTGADPVDDSLVHVQVGVIHYAGPKAGGEGGGAGRSAARAHWACGGTTRLTRDAARSRSRRSSPAPRQT